MTKTEFKKKIRKLQQKYNKEMDSLIDSVDFLPEHVFKTAADTKNETERCNAIREMLKRTWPVYPRKIGKRKGEERLLKGKYALSLDDIEKFSLAVRNLAEHVAVEDTEIRFIPHFSTFVTKWEDYLELKVTREMSW